jgi:hypothetical protein
MNNLDQIVTITQLLLLALTFIIIPIVAQKYGKRAQDAAEKAVADQGFEPGLLLKSGVKMTESKLEMLLPLAFAALYILVATMSAITGHLNHVLLWCVEGFTLVVVGLVTAQQVFVTLFMKRAFKNSKDERLHKINVERFVAAASREFPYWLRTIQMVRFALATIGALLVIVLVSL